jgi:hypothetical protein
MFRCRDEINNMYILQVSKDGETLSHHDDNTFVVKIGENSTDAGFNETTASKSLGLSYVLASINNGEVTNMSGEASRITGECTARDTETQCLLQKIKWWANPEVSDAPRGVWLILMKWCKPLVSDTMDWSVLYEAVLQQLLHAHSRGIVHCDVRMENIMMLDGAPVLIDWDLSVPVGYPQVLTEGRRYDQRPSTKIHTSMYDKTVWTPTDDISMLQELIVHQEVSGSMHIYLVTGHDCYIDLFSSFLFSRAYIYIYKLLKEGVEHVRRIKHTMLDLFERLQSAK